MSFAERMQARIADLQAWGQGIYERVPPRVRRNAQRAFSLAFLAVIGTVLYRQLRDLDWSEVLRSLPASPWFYVLFLVRFFNLPVVETLCYSVVWSTNLFRYFGTFLMKYILNTAVAGATGDVYFMMWAVRTLGITYRRAFSAVKDVTLLSAAAANAVAVLVLAGYFASGDVSLAESVNSGVVNAVVGVTLGAAALSLLLLAFRGKVLAVSTKVMWQIIGLHTYRSAGDLVALGLQWTAGLPGTTFGDWITLLIVALLIARTPGIPAKDFVFLSLALALGKTVDAGQTEVTAMLLADTALRQAALVPSFIVGALWRSRPHPVPLERPADPDPTDD